MAFDKILNAKINRNAKKLKLIEMLGGKCEHCGESRFYVLNFHHDLENFEKSFNIKELNSGRFSLLLEEVKKCIVLCSNCHQKHHLDKMNTYDKRTTTKQTLLNYKKVCSCENCGESDSRILTFHHLRDKKFDISTWVTNKNIDTIEKLSSEIKEELDKCIVLCHNCHADIHHDKEFYDMYMDQIVEYSNNIKEISKPLDKELVKKMYLDGMKQIDIARHFGTVKSTVCDILKTFGLTTSMADKTYDRQKLIDLHTKGYSNIEISEELNMLKNTVSRIILSLGLKPNIKKARIECKFDISKETLLEELKTQTVKEISEKYNVTVQTVYKKLRMYEIKTK